MPTPIPFADDGGTPTWRAHHALPPGPRFPIWRFLLAVAALPPLLAFMAAASWLAWMCFRGVMGPPGAIIALVGIAALVALIRRAHGYGSRLGVVPHRCGGAGRDGVGCFRVAGRGVGSGDVRRLELIVQRDGRLSRLHRRHTANPYRHNSRACGKFVNIFHCFNLTALPVRVPAQHPLTLLHAIINLPQLSTAG